MNFKAHKDEQEMMDALNHYQEIDPESLCAFLSERMKNNLQIKINYGLQDIIRLQNKLRILYLKHLDIETLNVLTLVRKIRCEMEQEVPMKH